ncbi:SDR family oxidoreductase, partial [bacterium]
MADFAFDGGQSLRPESGVIGRYRKQSQPSSAYRSSEPSSATVCNVRHCKPPTMLSLRSHHILVVGGSRGIGAASALLSAEAGADVSVVYRNDTGAAERVVGKIEVAGRKGFSVRADASEETELGPAVEAAVAALGPIHGLVVSAGIFEGLPLQEMTAEFWDRTMAMNLRSTFLAVKHAVPHMAPGASIVIYTSTAGQRGSAVYSAYAASKAAQIMFMRSMAKELAPAIRVNCIAPAWTETDMADAS